MSDEEARYRLRVATGFAQECAQDVPLQRWRSAVDNAQLATESAAKAVLALVSPVGKTHNPAALLRLAVTQGIFAGPHVPSVTALASCAEKLGADIRIQSDYGLEAEGLTPWDLFDEADALQAKAIADQAIELASALIASIQP